MVTAKALDFTNVKDGGGQFNRKHYPEGDYPGKVLAVSDAVKKGDKTKKMWLFQIQVKAGKYPMYCGFGENELWKIRNLFTACGVNITKKKLKLDPTRCIGKDIGVTLEDDEYEGKLRSSVSATFPLNELEGYEEVETSSGDDEEDDDEDDDTSASEEEEDDDEDEDEEPEPAPKKKKKKKAKPADDDDDLEELDIEDV